MNALNTYPHLISATGSIALLMIIQLIILDVIGIRAKHVPGATVTADHSNLLYRASRVVGNINESIGIFILLCIFCIASEASPMATTVSAWVFVIARVFYTIFYYANLQILRSTVFGVSLLALVAMLIAGAMEWF